MHNNIEINFVIIVATHFTVLLLIAHIVLYNVNIICQFRCFRYCVLPQISHPLLKFEICLDRSSWDRAWCGDEAGYIIPHLTSSVSLAQSALTVTCVQLHGVGAIMVFLNHPVVWGSVPTAVHTANPVTCPY